LLTLDDEQLFTGSKFGKAVLARQEAEAQALIAENRKIEAALEAEEKDLTARRAAMTNAEFAPLSEAFNTKVEGIRQAQDAKSRELTRAFEDEKLRFFEAVRPALAQIMKERGAVAIIDKRAVFVGFENVDITKAAIALLDQSLGDGTAPQPQPQPQPEPPPAP
jgi:Skp family chaperone for outer membrane proteins